MDNANNISGICPDCGKEISVPGHLEQFACMYCGKMLTADELLSVPAVLENDKTYDELLAEALPMLGYCVTEHAGIMREFTRKSYEDSFRQYTDRHQCPFYCLDQAAQFEDADPEEVVEQAVDAFLNEVAQDICESGKKSQADTLDLYRRIIALYMVPMVMRFKLSISSAFSNRLREKWIENYPKYPFLVGDYDTIAGGFRKKFLGLCFITSAVCEYSGKPDDCYELTTFRGFRDGYLKNCPDGPALIDEYYETAPVILTCMNYFGAKETELPNIRDRFLKPCLSDIENGKMESCKNRYVEMVRYLQNKYIPS